MTELPLADDAGEMVPQSGEQAFPSCISVQTTPLSVGSLVTVAVNCWVPPARTEALSERTLTSTPGTTTIHEPDFDRSFADVAVTLTVRPPNGGSAGAE